jgi:predicted DNA-binding protein with PD1-like motif
MTKIEARQKKERVAEFCAMAVGWLEDRAFRFYEPLPSTKQYGKADVGSLTELLMEAYLYGRTDEKKTKKTK